MAVSPSHDPVTSMLSGDVIDRLRRLELFSRYRVVGNRTGDNRSPLRGFSSDFLQHRQYFPGDSLKYLDWRVLAKSDKLVVRQFEELTNAPLYLILDASGSMAYKGRSYSKLEYAVRCAALLTYLMHLQQDTFGLWLFREAVATRLPPGGSRRHLTRLFELLVTVEAKGETDYPAVFRQVEAQATRKGIVVVLSDFMTPPEEVAKLMGRLRLRGHDVLVFQIVDPTERELDYVDFTRFRDLEDGEVIGADPLTIGEEYTRQFVLHEHRLKEACFAHGLDFVTLPVSDDFETPMGDYLRHRMGVML
jgi:uncharacterized protein (DUF58 family)